MSDKRLVMLWGEPYDVCCGVCFERMDRARYLAFKVGQPAGVYYYRCIQPECERYNKVVRLYVPPLHAEEVDADKIPQSDVAAENGEARESAKFFRRYGKYLVRSTFFECSGDFTVEQLYQAFAERLKAERT